MHAGIPRIRNISFHELPKGGKDANRPYLCVGGQLKGDTVDCEEQTLQVCELSCSEAEQPGCSVVHTTSGGRVPPEGVFDRD